MKHIALIAHDGMKVRLLDWAEKNKAYLSAHKLYATGTTGKLLSEKLSLDVHCFRSGPHGGDAQIGALIAKDSLDIMIFFIDPLTSLPHDVDVKALLRLAVLHDVVVAMNSATANFILTSKLANQPYQRKPLV